MMRESISIAAVLMLAWSAWGQDGNAPPPLPQAAQASKQGADGKKATDDKKTESPAPKVDANIGAASSESISVQSADSGNRRLVDMWYPFGMPYPYAHDARYPLEEALGYGDPISSAIRFGWWGIVSQGSQVKTGEYQNLSSSPFWDLDLLRSNGYRTVDLTASGLDNEANQGSLRVYGPLGRISLDFQRWERNLDHYPLANAADVSIANPQLFITNGNMSNRPVTANPTPVLFQDVNIGQDYAIRIEELKGEIAGNLTDNVKFRVQAFQLRKFGERQANAMARCYHPPEFGTKAPLGGIRACHVLSQRQAIDWNTTEVTPRLEGRWGPLYMEYAVRIQSFGQNDQIVTREENGTGTGLIQGKNLPYAVVPENNTYIHQLRLGLDITDRTRLYAFGWGGNTYNLDRDTHRDYVGYDVRLTDRTFNGLLLTAYTKGYHQNGTLPATLLPEEAKGVTETGPDGKTFLAHGHEVLRAPMEYHKTTAGVSSRWQPGSGNGLFGRTAYIGGYEYFLLNRDGADFETVYFKDRRTTLGIVDYSQPDTITNQFYAGIQQGWTDWLDTEVRYKIFYIHQPLYGFREINGFANTNLPEQKQVLELTETLRPLANVGFFFQQSIDLRRQNDEGPIIPGNLIDFTEQSYSFVNSLWWSPTRTLTLSGTGAWQSNWINQIISLGDEYIDPALPPPDPKVRIATDSQRWSYGGRAVVLGGRVDFHPTESVRFHGGYEWVRGDDRIGSQNLALIGKGQPGAQPWTDLPGYSQVLVYTQRITAGVDWRPRDRLSVYFRYILFDYEDKPTTFNSGTAHMFLGGCSYVW